MTERAAEARLQLTTNLPDDLPGLIADELRLRQILLNLIGNAIKFTPPGGTVAISCVAVEGERLVITVSDSGIGMDADETLEAMRPFGQVDSGLNRRHQGAGLGLPLTAALVAQHGGELRLDSAKGRGTDAMVIFRSDRMLSTGSAPRSRGVVDHGSLPG